MSPRIAKLFGTGVLLAFISSGSQAQTGGPDSEPAKTVSQFLSAIESGNVAALKATLATPATPELERGLDRWAGTTASFGKKLVAQFKPVTASRIAGEFAVVYGGFSDKPYMRLWRQNGQWKILGPGDAKTLYGLNNTKQLTLSSLEKWADREWKNPPAPPAAALPEATST